MLAASIRRAVLAALITAVFSAGARTHQAPQPQPTFRSISTLVPLDVRVLDRDGHPVTDLTQSDFTVLEDGVVQNIAHFSAQPLEPLAAEALKTEPPLRGAGGALTTPRRRVILLVMGRGTLEHPFDAVTAARDFVRTRLMPQDYVAVMAYNRATDFTTDHQTVAAVLDRFREKHENIDRRFNITLSGLQLLYGDRRIPASIQKDIDWIFEPAGGDVRVAAREPEAIDPRKRQIVLGDMEEIIYDMKHSGGAPLSADFESFVNWIMPTMHDAGSIHAGIEFLRYVEGEKRLIFVTEQGFSLPRTESDLRLAEAASEARVAIDTIHTGGVVAEVPGAQRAGDDIFRRMSAMSTLKILTDDTGGHRFSTVRPETAFERIDTSTRFQYALGYYPADQTKDGRFREVRVTVNRPGVTVLVRRGYSATHTPPAPDRTRIMTDMRILTAASVPQPLTDIRVGVTVSTAKGADGVLASRVSGGIETKRLGWNVSDDGRYRVTLELAVLCSDSRGLLIGEHRQPLMLTISKADYEKSLSSGLTYNLSIPVSQLPSAVKVIVYDPGKDLLGSASWRPGR